MLFIGMSFRKIHRHEQCSHQYLFIYPYDDVFYFCFSVFFLPHLLYNDSDQKLTFRDPCYKTVCRNMDCSSASKKELRKLLLRVENELCQMQKIFLLKVNYYCSVVVAQLVEHFLGKEEVVGSSPANSTIYLYYYVLSSTNILAFSCIFNFCFCYF